MGKRNKIFILSIYLHSKLTTITIFLIHILIPHFHVESKKGCHEVTHYLSSPIHPSPFGRRIEEGEKEEYPIKLRVSQKKKEIIHQVNHAKHTPFHAPFHFSPMCLKQGKLLDFDFDFDDFGF